MPRVSEEHTEARRAQILRAALACFARKGVHATTIRDICTEAGLSAGAVYNYFPAKRDILEGVFEASLAENAEMFAAVAANPDPLAAIETIRDLSFGPLDDPEGLELSRAAISVLEEAVRDPRLAERYAEVQRDLATRLAGLVTAAQTKGVVDATLDADALGRMLLAAHDGWRIQKLAEPDLDTRAFLAALDRVLGLQR